MLDIGAADLRRREVLRQLSDEEITRLIWRTQWQTTARPKQMVEGDFWTIYGIMAGRGFGKLIDANEVVPVPQGWVRLGDIEIGDQVFDESGRICRVVKVFDATPDIAYRLTFSDGTYIDACADHQWVTWRHADRKEYLRHGADKPLPDEWPAWKQRAHGPAIRTTQEIVDTLTYGRRYDLNHSVPVAGALVLPERDLAIDPYVLGYWLGDGTTTGAQFTAHEDDQSHLIAALNSAGYEASANKQTVNVRGLRVLLRKIGVLGRKDVPLAYMRASVQQRLALLQGLMDSDGSAVASSVEFCNTNKRLVRCVVELARSLGQKPVCAESRSMLNGIDHGTKWRVTWRPTINVFRLPRKLARVKLVGKQGSRSAHRMIVSAERITPAPMRCLTVDGRHSMFLVGEGMIPTHNTLTGANWLGWEAANDPDSYNAVIAPTSSDLTKVCFEGPVGLMRTIPPELVKDYNRTDVKITLTNGAQIFGFSAEKADRLRGPQHHRVWGDELAAWMRAEEAWDMMMFGLRLGDHPQVLYTTTPKPVALVRRLVKGVDGKTNILVRGTTYENKANLPKSFFDQVQQYEGTKLGRQELHGELIDPSESGIVKRSNFNLWPHDKPLPEFEWIVVSLDTAFTEHTIDKKTFDPDPTACTVWGAFYPLSAITYKHGDRIIGGSMNLMLLDCWSELLGLPDLIDRAKKELKNAYGPIKKPLIRPLIGPSFGGDQGRKPDILLVEDKGSGISLRQVLAKEDIHAYPYNPGKASKLQRLHMVSHVFAHGMVWLVESERMPGTPKTWTEPLLEQLTTFVGEGSIPHDDFVDSTTQAVRLFLDRNIISVTDLVKAQEAAKLASEKSPYGVPLIQSNPYAS